MPHYEKQPERMSRGTALGLAGILLVGGGMIAGLVAGYGDLLKGKIAESASDGGDSDALPNAGSGSGAPEDNGIDYPLYKSDDSGMQDAESTAAADAGVAPVVDKEADFEARCDDILRHTANSLDLKENLWALMAVEDYKEPLSELLARCPEGPDPYHLIIRGAINDSDIFVAALIKQEIEIACSGEEVDELTIWMDDLSAQTASLATAKNPRKVLEVLNRDNLCGGLSTDSPYANCLANNLLKILNTCDAVGAKPDCYETRVKKVCGGKAQNSPYERCVAADSKRAEAEALERKRNCPEEHAHQLGLKYENIERLSNFKELLTADRMLIHFATDSIGITPDVVTVYIGHLTPGLNLIDDPEMFAALKLNNRQEFVQKYITNVIAFIEAQDDGGYDQSIEQLKGLLDRLR